MVAHHIHDAIAQVKRLQELVLEKRLFRGYSGKARIVGGLTALAGTVALASRHIPPTVHAHLMGWAAVLAIGLAVNYGAVAWWFFTYPEDRRSGSVIVPAMDALPALAVGAALTLVALLRGYHDLLFGIWMALYGLAHVPYRLSLPAGNYAVGVFYLLCGIGCILAPGIRFTNPWPMGIVFAIGELAGGMVLIRLKRDSAELPPAVEPNPEEEHP